MDDDRYDEYLADRVLSSFELLFKLTDFGGWPADEQEQQLRDIVTSGPDSISFIAAPTGKALGYRVQGDDAEDAFTSELLAQAEHMLGPNAEMVLSELFGGLDERTVELEYVFGIPSWYRIGVSIDSFAELTQLLDMMGTPPEAQERAVRFGDVEGARPDAFYIFITGQSQWTYMPTTRLQAPPSVFDDNLVGDGSLVVDQTIRDYDRTWLRRPGLDDRDLIDWQDARGFGGDDAGTVGEIQGSLGYEGPDWMAWEEGNIQDSLVYVYEDPVSLE